MTEKENLYTIYNDSGKEYKGTGNLQTQHRECPQCKGTMKSMPIDTPFKHTIDGYLLLKSYSEKLIVDNNESEWIWVCDSCKFCRHPELI